MPVKQQSSASRNGCVARDGVLPHLAAMKRFALRLLSIAILGLWAVSATAQVYPNIPPNTVLGRLGSGNPGPPQALPIFSIFKPVNPNIARIGSSAVFANASTGSDSNDCLAATTSSFGSGPCLTLYHAFQVSLKYDNSGLPITLNVAAGTYTNTNTTQSLAFNGSPRGSSQVGTFISSFLIQGAGSSTTIIDDTTANCFTILASGSGTRVLIAGVTIQKSSGCSGAAGAIFAQQNASIETATDVAFGVSIGQFIHVETFGVVEVIRNINLTGNAETGFAAGGGGNILFDGITITCNGITALTDAFAYSGGPSSISMSGVTFSGCSGVTGTPFNVFLNGVIDTGSAGYPFIPGSNQPVMTSGGQYSPIPAAVLGTCTNGVLRTGSTRYNMWVSFTGDSSSCAIVTDNGAYFNWYTAPVCVASWTIGTALAVTPATTGVTVAGSFVNNSSVFIHCEGTPY